MTLDEILKFSEEDLTTYIQIMQNQLNECVPVFESLEKSVSIIDIETYYEARFAERRNKPEILWPKELSKRERIICKANMLLSMLNTLIVDTPNKDTAVDSAKVFVKSIIKDSYQSTVTKTNKKTQEEYKTYDGIPPRAAEVLNVIYHSIIEKFQGNIYR